MITGEWRAPVGENALKTPLRDVRFDHSFWHVGQPKTRDGAVQQLRSAVAGELTLDTHLELAITLLEFPGIEAAVCRQPQIDAVVEDEVLWLLRLRAPFEVGRRADYRH